MNILGERNLGGRGDEIININIDLPKPNSGVPPFFAGIYSFVKILSFKSLNKKERKKERKKKRKKEKIEKKGERSSCSRRVSNSARRRHKPAFSPLGHERLFNFTTHLFFHDKLPINMKMLVFSLAKCVRTAAKTMVVDKKNQKVLALLYLASKLLRNAANSSDVPTEFAAEPTTKMKS